MRRTRGDVLSLEGEVRRHGNLRREELKALELENARLKRMVADQALDIQMLKDLNAKKW